jgi:shikimate dehydrogenase
MRNLLRILSGYELYFYQGFHAIGIFHGGNVEEPALRAALVRGFGEPH